ncbi:MAG TPA: tryptophan--tRNA ligase [Bacillota bacterium]|nr:tryptophan--tRNA ligase [Bacillota bacterium]
MSKGTILSGMRPTGRLHMGHMSVLENWAKLQDEYKCYFMVADWHAMTTNFEDTGKIRENTLDMVVDWLSAGLDPEKSSIFVQSRVPQHAELHLIFSMLTPISWLERCPTFKEQVQNLGEQGKDINTYGFLGYPLLQAADILVYLADTVPVGEDQLPHVEMTREVARRFNFMYNTKLFPESKALLAKVALLPGTDGRKMSKSYNNDIAIGASSEEILSRVRSMVTDPARVRKNDPGHPEVCVVYSFQKIYNPEGIEEIATECQKGTIGCVECKKRLAAKLDAFMAPCRERREYALSRPGLVEEILEAGREQATKAAEHTLAEVHKILGF